MNKTSNIKAINSSLIKSISKHTGITDEIEVINKALSEYLGHLRRKNLMNAYGKIDIDLDVREFRNRESTKMRKLYGPDY